MEKRKRLILRIFAGSFIIMLIVNGCSSTTNNKDYYWKGKELYQKRCSSCHLMKNAANWTPPSLSNLADLDSTLLLNKLKSIESDKIHKLLSRDLYPDYEHHLLFYIRHAFDVEAGR